MDEETLEQLSRLLYKEIYSIKDLLNLRLFGCKSTIHREIKMRKLKAFYSADRRLMVLREDLIDYLKAQNDVDNIG